VKNTLRQLLELVAAVALVVAAANQKLNKIKNIAVLLL